MENCIGLLETVSIARGIEAADAMVKESPVVLRLSRPVHPGKYATLVSGEVDEVRRALDRGRDVAAEKVVDSLFLPYAHPTLLPAAFLEEGPAIGDALGVIETFSMASTLIAADAAAKTTAAELALVRLADGLGGKGYFLITGAVEDVEASIDAAAALLEPGGMLLERTVIAQVHPELVDLLATRHGDADDGVIRALSGNAPT